MVLREWIHAAHSKKEEMVTSRQNENSCFIGDFDVETFSHVAWEVSKGIADIHNNGVSHNNITADNIIIKMNKDDGSISIRIIDLGQASVLVEQDNKADKIKKDLCSLGLVLFELFMGIDPFQSKDLVFGRADFVSSGNKPSVPVVGTEGSNGVSQSNEELKSLLTSKTPLIVSTIIFNLMEGNHYQSAEEVDLDFYTILTDPGYYLHSTNSRFGINLFGTQINVLRGREKEMSMLMDIYNRVSRFDGVSELVLVSGYSGAGKSALVQNIRDPVQCFGGIFICGKFEQLQEMEPLSAITTMFADLWKDLLKRDKNTFLQIKAAIEESLGSELNVLASVIPSLRQIVDIRIEETPNTGGIEAQNRLKHTFRLLVRAIAASLPALVIFLDDLQWADHVSLYLFESLITDTECTSLLLIGSYREHEVNDTHPLAAILRKIQRKQIRTTKIKVNSLSKEDTNELISGIIQTPPHLTQSLSDAIHRKTSGNAMFVLQLLSSLYGEGLLYFLLETKQWQWNTAAIESKNIADNAVELMSHKISKLQEETQHALKLLSCLGSFCEESVLCMILPRDNKIVLKQAPKGCSQQAFRLGYTSLILSLELAVKEGLINHVDSKYKFVHDMIQLSSYHLIPEDERGQWHLWIGNQIWANRDTSPEKALYIAVGQLNKGAMHIHDTSQKIELACRNLEAGEKCISLATFAPASIYLESGIGLLGEKCWMDHYDICLRLHDAYADAKHCACEFGVMEAICNEIFTNAKCFNDKIHSYCIVVNALNAQGKPQEALKVGLPVLIQLGEAIETSCTKATTISELMKTKQMMSGKTDDDFLTMKEINRGDKIAALRLLGSLSLSARIKDQKLLPLIILRMVQISLCYGICNESILSFAQYGGLLVSLFHDISEGFRLGRLSLHLLEKLKVKASLAPVFLVFYSSVHSCVESHHASLEPLRHSYDTGMKFGNIHYALMSAHQYCIHSFQCGRDLSMVEETCKDYARRMKEHNILVLSKSLLPYRQVALNLMGRSEDPLQLIGDAMDQNELLKYSFEGQHMHIVSSIYHLRSRLAFIFGEYELASKMADKSKVLDLTNLTPFVRSDYVFVDGLISFALSHKENSFKWKKIAWNAIKTMETYAQYAPSNFQHRYLLLQAESAFLSGDDKNASTYYDAAIKTAGENSYVQDQAVAYERAGIFYFSKGNVSLASHCYGQAHAAFLRWGACCKADHLRLHSPF